MNLLKRLLERLAQPAPPDGVSVAPGPEARRLVLDELRNVLARQSESGDALDSKLKELLGTASLVITLVTALQVAAGTTGAALVLGALIATLVLFLGLTVTTLVGIWPREYHSPIPTGQKYEPVSVKMACDEGWEEIRERYFGLGEEKAVELLISTHLVCINKNRRPLRSKVRCLRVAFVLLALIVVVVIAMGIGAVVSV